jgi:hypothetical protein
VSKVKTIINAPDAIAGEAPALSVAIIFEGLAGRP